MASDRPGLTGRNLLGAITGAGLIAAFVVGVITYRTPFDHHSPDQTTQQQPPHHTTSSESAYQRYIGGVAASNKQAIENMGGHAGRIDDPILEGCKHAYGADTDDAQVQACALRLHVQEDAETQAGLDRKARQDAEDIRLYGAPKP
jgi:hypothetical protein